MKYVLDTTVLVDHVRRGPGLTGFLLSLLLQGNQLSTTCVSIAELEQGLLKKEKRAADTLLERLDFLPTTREAAVRAGRYLAHFRARGRTLQLPDALIAGTARVHGAVLVTHNAQDFPMRDIRVLSPPE